MKQTLKGRKKTISNFIKHEKSLQMLLMSICTNIAHAAPSDRCAESASEWKGNVVVPLTQIFRGHFEASLPYYFCRK